MKQLLPLALAPLVLAIVHADTIRLRDGKHFEATVLSEADDHYVILVKVTETIREQRRIPKNKILEIVREKKDEIAFEELQELVPTPDRLDVEAYDSRIERLARFMEKFPDSPRVSTAEAMIKTLEAEREVIAAGGVKFDGELLGAEDRREKAFTIDSRIVEAELNDALSKGRRIEALRAWDELEKEFPTSTAYTDNLPRILDVMRTQLAAVEKALETYDQRVGRRAENMSRVPEKDRDRARQAIEDQASDYLDRIAEEREEGIRWLSLDPFQEEPLHRAKSLLESEIRRLEELDTRSIPNGDQAWKEAWTTLHADPNPDEAREAISKARDARLPERYIDMLEAEAPES